MTLLRGLDFIAVMDIPEIPLKPAPKTAPAKKAIGFKWNDEAGKRHKLGGKPDWLQKKRDETPNCADCREKMTFYGQLDSIGSEYDLADCGMIYVFVCFGCFTTQSVLQAG
ncbi:MAG: hypothetical protein ACR2H1_10750 [Limisphaerales bacterium]